MDFRTETDKLGSLTLPEDTLYGIGTKRAIENFPLNSQLVSPHLIHSMILVKKAAALTHLELKDYEETKGNAIVEACDDLLHFTQQCKTGIAGNQEQVLFQNTYTFSDLFPTHPLQGGAGTSTNTNINEVIANTALKKLGYRPGQYHIIHPLDDINKFQSTNDVYPTALRIACIELVRKLSTALSHLQEALQEKEQAFDSVQKLGRTELMDAVPITLGEEFGAYAQCIGRDRWRIYKVEERLRQVNLGGTAVGNGTNTSKRYRFKVVEHLRDFTGFGIALAEYPMDFTQNADVFTEVSGLLKSCAVNLMKISNDLRLLNSGPHGGLGEITLKPLQPGSTIMPGKINPVLPEMVGQVAMQVMANDTAITFACSNGQLELNAFLPLIADRLLESLELLSRAVSLFQTKCITPLLANKKICKKHLEESTVFITAFVPYIGYDNATRIHAACNGNAKLMKSLLLEEGLLSENEINQIITNNKMDEFL